MTWQAIKACLTHKVWARVIQASCPVCLDAQDGTVLLLLSLSSLVASFLCSALGDQAGGHRWAGAASQGAPSVCYLQGFSPYHQRSS